MAHILYIAPGYVPPPDDERESAFFYLSESHWGDVLLPVWGKRSSIPRGRGIGRFCHHVTYSCRLPGPIRLLWELLFYVCKGLALQRAARQKYDVVISYGWNKTGIAAVILKWLTGAKLIVEIPGTPGAAQRFQSLRVTWLTRLKGKTNRWFLKLLMKRADGAKLLSPNQLDGYLPERKVHALVYHDMVPVNSLDPVDVDEKYLLLVGYPWYLKGVDVLIKAFKQIADEFPGYRLRIVGHCPDRSYFEKLRDDDARIEFLPGVKHDVAIRLISRCSVFVLASRTEAMGRVLLEAMALRKPIVASRVDGIPHYIHHNENGLLFESEDVDDLAAKLRHVLRDRLLAARLADTGYRVVREKYSESRFVEAWDTLIESVTGSSPTRCRNERANAVAHDAASGT